MTNLPKDETEMNALFARLDATAGACATILNASNPARPCRWVASGLSATFPLPTDDHHTVAIEIDAMQQEGRVYLRIRTNIHSNGLSSSNYGSFLAHLAGVHALVVACRTICDTAGFAEPE